MRPDPSRLDVVRGSSYLSEQESFFQKRKNRLATPIALLWVTTPLVVIAQVIAYLAYGTPLIPLHVTGILLVLSVAVFPVLSRIDRYEAQEGNFASGRQGEEQLTAFLTGHLDNSWRLYRNLLLPDGKGDIDALLLGPRGLFVLEVKAWTGAYRIHGKTWQRQNSTGHWHTINFNPSEQARWNARRLQAFLHSQGLSLPVQQRVVWAGPGNLTFSRPVVPLWLLAKPAFVLADLEKAEVLAPDTLRQTAGLLSRSQP
jgi:hypothetical protein